MKPIDLRQASLQTCTVSIQALVIGKKQMTLSVFRQLERVQLIDSETLQLRGIPWGRVNYFWDDCGQRVPRHEHLHVVWQRDSQLCRACVSSEAGFDCEPSQKLAALDNFRHELRNLGTLFRLRSEKPDSWPYSNVFKFAGVELTLDDSGYIDTARKFWEAVNRLEAAEKRPYHYRNEPQEDYVQKCQEAVSSASQTFEELIESECRKVGVTSREDVRESFADCITSAKVFKLSWASRHAELAALPQLFIAV